MTTDYSADVRAMLERLQGPPPEMTFSADEMLRVADAFRHLADLFKPMQDELQAARAEAQRLREQRDALADFIRGLGPNILRETKDGNAQWYSIGGPMRADEWEPISALLDTIATEDASAQGGE